MFSVGSLEFQEELQSFYAAALMTSCSSALRLAKIASGNSALLTHDEMPVWLSTCNHFLLNTHIYIYIYMHTIFHTYML